MKYERFSRDAFWEAMRFASCSAVSAALVCCIVWTEPNQGTADTDDFYFNRAVNEGIIFG